MGWKLELGMGRVRASFLHLIRNGHEVMGHGLEIGSWNWESGNGPRARLLSAPNNHISHPPQQLFIENKPKHPYFKVLASGMAVRHRRRVLGPVTCTTTHQPKIK
jgi:hypothetical protein